MHPLFNVHVDNLPIDCVFAAYKIKPPCRLRGAEVEIVRQKSGFFYKTIRFPFIAIPKVNSRRLPVNNRSFSLLPAIPFSFHDIDSEKWHALNQF